MLYFVIFWIVCGVLSTGLDFAFYQRAYPNIAAQFYTEDLIAAYVSGLGGPFNLLIVLMDYHRRISIMRFGLKFW